MARVTVEDCLRLIPNRFELTLVATHRARQIASSPSNMLDNSYGSSNRDSREKPTVVALREVELGKVGPEVLIKTTN